MDQDRIANPQLTDAEREVIAHLFEVIFGILDKIPGMIPEDVCLHCVRHELRRLVEGHINE